jgi:DNA polymerase-1
MYLTPTKNHWAADIEADDLLEGVTTIWCITLCNVITKEEVEFTDGESFRLWQSDHPDAIYVGHNFVAYDAVVLNRLWGAAIPIGRIVDTFILSQLYHPTFGGGHSLDAWGKRLGYCKGAHGDFSRFTEGMLRYCRRDTRLTALLFRRLTERMRSCKFTEEGCRLEHQAWNIIQNKQRRHGFPFDIRRAIELYTELRQREEELKNEIYKLWPPVLTVVGEYKRPFKKDGEPSAQYLRHREQYPRVELSDCRERYFVSDYVEFNLGSPQQRIEKLLSLGWTPTKLTKGGSPAVDEDTLLDYAESSGTPEVKALAKWIVVNSRANMVNTWIEAYNEKTGCIHGKLFIASTLRYRHSGPNSANIPAVRLKKVKQDDGTEVEEIQYGEDGAWTYECRDLWTCGDSDGYSLVGIDGTGIQNRCLVNGLIKVVGEEAVRPFKELSLSGDIHKRNIEVLELANKAAAKKFYYTLMMGGGGKRLAGDQAQFGTKMTPEEGNQKREAMIASIPGFGDLISSLEKELENSGRITLCDGTPILVPSPHMVIPYLLQGDESRLMKRAMVYVDEEVRRHGLSPYVFKVADIHDEWQYKVKNEYVERFIELAIPCFLRAGESFGYRIAIEGDYKVGKTWAQTH